MHKLLFFLLFTPVLSIAQITTMGVKKVTEENITVKYDSTANFLGLNVEQYLGQDLYLNGVNEGGQKYGYNGFYIDYNKKSLITLNALSNTYKAIMPDKPDLIKYDIGSGRSEFDSLYGTYFKVIEIIKPNQTNFDKYFLKLFSKSTNDTVYFQYDQRFEHNFPFIVVAYMDKLKKNKIGKKLIFKTKSIEGTEDINTGDPILYKKGDIWECKDMIIEDTYYKIAYLLKSQSGNEVIISERTFKHLGVFSIAEATKYRNKYGLAKWNTILDGEVSLGMTKEMCELSWGEPDDINKTISSGKTSEQWVYSENYLYFDNGVLTTIQ